MQKKLLILSFIEGAVVMVAELCGAKLLAPIFGSSLYVWASVMGITLGALAIGYFYGGWLSDKSKTSKKKLEQILVLAALFILVMPVLSYYLVPRISYLPFLVGVVISTFTLLFLPVFFLGATSPLFILLQTSETVSAGKASGTVYAISTAGGILSTFLCGFYLIPTLGLNVCLISFGLILFITTIFVFKFLKPVQLLCAAVCIYLNLQFIKAPLNIDFKADSVLGHLEVKTILSKNSDSVRLLTINNIVQTEMNMQTKQSVSEYVKILDTLITGFDNTSTTLNVTAKKKALVLGLGGGLVANLLVGKNYSVDGLEFDNRIIDAAKNYFYIDKHVNAVCADARYFLNHCTKKYDVIVVDIFKAEEQPSHVLTLQSLNQLKNNLNQNAILLINWHGYISGNKGLGTTILYNTLTKAGFNVQLNSMSKDENYRNIVFLASLQTLTPCNYQLNETLANSSLVNTDNYPLLEKYNASANKTWRSNYLRYYQNL
ncbi:MAG: fused MFS/spermidine synthase [Bacteroidota bacterium]|nr:fused MFS/spermidine synthase [Bacteroidota bacterium]